MRSGCGRIRLSSVCTSIFEVLVARGVALARESARQRSWSRRPLSLADSATTTKDQGDQSGGEHAQRRWLGRGGRYAVHREVGVLDAAGDAEHAEIDRGDALKAGPGEGNDDVVSCAAT